MSKEDFSKMTNEELIALKDFRLEHYAWLRHFEYDDGDSDMYYFEAISPIDDELKRRGIEK